MTARPAPPERLVVRLIAEVGEERDIPVGRIRARSPSVGITRAVSDARWEVWRRLVEMDRYSVNGIAIVFGCNHASIINARDKGWKVASERAAEITNTGFAKAAELAR